MNDIIIPAETCLQGEVVRPGTMEMEMEMEMERYENGSEENGLRCTVAESGHRVHVPIHVPDSRSDSRLGSRSCSDSHSWSPITFLIRVYSFEFVHWLFGDLLSEVSTCSF